ncbi:MAG: ATP-binding cassette domain-containing protein [Clostridium sp.]
MNELLYSPVKRALTNYPYIEDYFEALGLLDFGKKTEETIEEYITGLNETRLEEDGFNKEILIENLLIFIEKMELLKKKKNSIESLTIIGGYNKNGEKENINLTIKKGSIISIVGPTGSGKSRLLSDIECLSQGDTQTGRNILVNGVCPKNEERFSIENKLIAQLSQNMNFVMDLPVRDFLRLHGESRMINNIEETVETIIQHANKLAGEKFTGDTPLTQLSGGQSRALMIADTALLSASPIVLIDEIENAGVDRKEALNLLVKKEKIVLMSTHDPILALMGEKRIIIENGGIKKIIETTEKERENLLLLEKLDIYLLDLRNMLRKGELIDFPIKDVLGG